MWKSKFKLVGIEPGRIFHPKIGYVDFSRDDVPEEVCEQLVKEQCPHLERITQKPATKVEKIEKASE